MECKKCKKTIKEPKIDECAKCRKKRIQEEIEKSELEIIMDCFL